MINEGLLHGMQIAVFWRQASIVVTWRPSACTAGVRHDTTRRPSRCTVHAPHCPWSQPFLAPVNPSCSRSTSSSDERGSRVSVCSVPFTTIRVGTAAIVPAFATPDSAATVSGGSITVVAAMVAQMALFAVNTGCCEQEVYQLRWE